MTGQHSWLAQFLFRKPTSQANSIVGLDLTGLRTSRVAAGQKGVSSQTITAASRPDATNTVSPPRLDIGPRSYAFRHAIASCCHGPFSPDLSVTLASAGGASGASGRRPPRRCGAHARAASQNGSSRPGDGYGPSPRPGPPTSDFDVDGQHHVSAPWRRGVLPASDMGPL